MQGIGYIYVLKHPTTGEIRYVGQTQQQPKARLSQHKNQKIEKPAGGWVNYLKGQELSPEMEVIETINRSRLDEREEYYIDRFRELGIDLLNILSVGQGRRGYRPPQIVREKISASVKDYWNNLDENTKDSIIQALIDVQPDWTGKKHTQASRDQQSESAKKRHQREQARIAEIEKLLAETPDQPDLVEELEQLKNLHKGVYSEDQIRRQSESLRIRYNGEIPPHLDTPEARQKSADARRGQPMSEEQKELLRQANLGKTLSVETREKIGDAHRGRKDSPETRANKSAAQSLRVQEHGMNPDLYSPESITSRSKELTRQWATGERVYIKPSPEIMERANKERSESNAGKTFLTREQYDEIAKKNKQSITEKWERGDYDYRAKTGPKSDKKGRIYTEDHQDVIDLYLAGYGVKEIAVYYDVTHGSISNIIDKYGVRKEKVDHTKEIIRLYTEEMLSIEKIAERIDGISTTTVKNRLNENNIPIRNKTSYSSLTDEMVVSAIYRQQQGEKIKDMAEEFGVKRNTLQERVRKMKKKMGLN